MNKYHNLSKKILFIFFIVLLFILSFFIFIFFNITEQYKEIIIKLDSSQKNFINKIQLLNLYLLIIAFFISVLVLSFLLTYIVKKNIIFPINHLIYLTNQISTGNLDLKSNLSLNNEIGKLSDNFNLMINGLKKYQTELLNKELELSKLNKIDFIAKLSSGLAHELKHPIQNIKLILSNINNSNFDEIINELKEEISKIEKVTYSISEFAKLKNIESEKINIKSEIDKILNSIICPHNINILNNIKINIEINFNSFLFHTLITNLLYNAFNAMPDGGNIQLFLNIENDFIKLIIEDEGIGILEKDKEKIFEPFISLSSKKSTGIGLTLCKEIINYFSGKIELENRNDKNGLRVNLFFRKEKIKSQL